MSTALATYGIVLRPQDSDHELGDPVPDGKQLDSLIEVVESAYSDHMNELQARIRRLTA